MLEKYDDLVDIKPIIGECNRRLEYYVMDKFMKLSLEMNFLTLKAQRNMILKTLNKDFSTSETRAWDING